MHDRDEAMSVPSVLIEELDVLVRSRYGLIVIETEEEARVGALVAHLADRLNLPLLTWSRTQGLKRGAEAEGPVYGTMPAQAALSHIETSKFPAVYHLRGIGPDLESPVVIERLKEGAQYFSEHEGTIILTGDALELPRALERHVARVRMPAPDKEEYRTLLVQVLHDVGERQHVDVQITNRELEQLLQNLKGLTLLEAEKVLTKALVVDNLLSAADIQRVIEAKREIVEREGILEYYPATSTMAEIAGLHGLKRWLAQRTMMISQPDEAARLGLSFPKGVLLVGIPGTGKSLAAKTVAMEWKLPLLKLDPASLYNKYVGETERNFRRAMETAERVSPVVLWIDEIEKAFASSDGGHDGGVSTRVLGIFLSWLQDRKGDVFCVATANDVSRLPPELLRKGRFDELFFLDLPSTEVRRELFRIHLEKRKQRTPELDLDVLAESSGGYTGADIEQVVLSALYATFSAGEVISTTALVRELNETRPLSQTMPERIQALRQWAKGRTVSAD